MKVYVPTWNNERTIVRCLTGIKDSVPNADIIVVDNFSSDKTVELASPIANTIVQKKYNLGEARTWICATCPDEWFFMVDSDSYPHSSWASELMEWLGILVLTDPKLGAICGWPKETPLIIDPKLKQIIQRLTPFNVVAQKQNVAQRNYGRFQPNGAIFNRKAVAGFNTHSAGMEDYLIGKYIIDHGFNHYSVPVFLQHNQFLDSENLARRCRVMGAFWRSTGYTHLPNLIVNLFRAPLKVPSGTRQFVFKNYLNYLVGYFMCHHFVKDYKWAKA
jgi:glycosyltransferase involved in cell wall biosynthesis